MGGPHPHGNIRLLRNIIKGGLLSYSIGGGLAGGCAGDSVGGDSAGDGDAGGSFSVVDHSGSSFVASCGAEPPLALRGGAGGAGPLDVCGAEPPLPVPEPFGGLPKSPGGTSSSSPPSYGSSIRGGSQLSSGARSRSFTSLMTCFRITPMFFSSLPVMVISLQPLRICRRLRMLNGAVKFLRLLLEGQVSTVAHLRRRPRHNALQDVALRQPLAWQVPPAFARRPASPELLLPGEPGRVLFAQILVPTCPCEPGVPPLACQLCLFQHVNGGRLLWGRASTAGASRCLWGRASTAGVVSGACRALVGRSLHCGWLSPLLGPAAAAPRSTVTRPTPLMPPTVPTPLLPRHDRHNGSMCLSRYATMFGDMCDYNVMFSSASCDVV